MRIRHHLTFRCFTNISMVILHPKLMWTIRFRFYAIYQNTRLVLTVWYKHFGQTKIIQSKKSHQNKNINKSVIRVTTCQGKYFESKQKRAFCCHKKTVPGAVSLFRGCTQSMKSVFNLFVKSMPFYSVARGRITGVFATW